VRGVRSSFDPKRKDAKYCCRACRFKAYRARKQVAERATEGH